MPFAPLQEVFCAVLEVGKSCMSGYWPFVTAPSAGSNFPIATGTKPLTASCNLSSIVFTTGAKLIFSQSLYGSHRQS